FPEESAEMPFCRWLTLGSLLAFAPSVNGQTGKVIDPPVEPAQIAVKNTAPRPVSFANDVMPIPARAGCNSGACHGAAAGKKGFKISLRGYDPANDYLSLTRATNGRRLDFVNPANSLLVLKPTGQVPHEGGKRFDRQHPYAKTLTRWIAEGATNDLAIAAKLVGLEVTPAFRSFSQTGLAQKLLVTARYSDGTSRDV